MSHKDIAGMCLCTPVSAVFFYLIKLRCYVPLIQKTLFPATPLVVLYLGTEEIKRNQ